MRHLTSSTAYRVVGLAAILGLAAWVATQLLTLSLIVMIMIILALPLSAAASRAQRLMLPRAVGALAALLAVVLIVTVIGFLLVPQFVDQVNEFSRRLPSTLRAAERYVGLGRAGGVHTDRMSNEVTHVVGSYTRRPQRLIAPLAQIGSTAVGVLGGVILIVLGAFLIAVNPQPLISTLLRLIPARAHPQAS